jgi:hypothetical protein
VDLQSPDGLHEVRGCLFGFVWTQVTYPTGAAVPPGRSGATLSAFSGSLVLEQPRRPRQPCS